jgi:hypothetical protein
MMKGSNIIFNFVNRDKIFYLTINKDRKINYYFDKNDFFEKTEEDLEKYMVFKNTHVLISYIKNRYLRDNPFIFNYNKNNISDITATVLDLRNHMPRITHSVSTSLLSLLSSIVNEIIEDFRLNVLRFALNATIVY